MDFFTFIKVEGQTKRTQREPSFSYGGAPLTHKLQNCGDLNGTTGTPYQRFR